MLQTASRHAISLFPSIPQFNAQGSEEKPIAWAMPAGRIQIVDDIAKALDLGMENSCGTPDR
jgi:hypothetical protein